MARTRNTKGTTNTGTSAAIGSTMTAYYGACQTLRGVTGPLWSKLSPTLTEVGGLLAQQFLGRGPPAQNASATQPARRTRKTAAKASTAGAGSTNLTERVYGMVPATGGIQQASITVPGTRANIIGAALSRLQKRGRLVNQNGVWFRATAQQQQAA